MGDNHSFICYTDPKSFQIPKGARKIFESDLPPIITVRSTSCLVIVYGFLDASVSGFGSTLLVRRDIEYRISTWSSLEDTNSLNWREFENLMCDVEQAGLQVWLKDSNI